MGIISPTRDMSYDKRSVFLYFLGFTRISFRFIVSISNSSVIPVFVILALSEAKLEKQTKGFAIVLMGNEHLGFSLFMGLAENQGEFFSSLRNKAGLT